MPVLGAVVLIDMFVFKNGVEGLRFSEVGLKLQILSAGAPEHVKVTVPEKATIADTSMGTLVVEPREFNAIPAPASLLTTKSGVAISGGLVEPT